MPSSWPRGVGEGSWGVRSWEGSGFLWTFLLLFIPSPLAPHHAHLAPIVSLCVFPCLCLWDSLSLLSLSLCLPMPLSLGFSFSIFLPLLISLFLSFPVLLPMSLSLNVLCCFLSASLPLISVSLSLLTLGSPFSDCPSSLCVSL